MEINQYKSFHRLRDLIDDNSSLLMAISRFGISLGFGDATVEEVCRKNNVHMPTFLAVANLLSGYGYDPADVSLTALMEYLCGAHSYFIEFLLPSIRRKLIDAVNYGGGDSEMSLLLLRFFDEYVEEIKSHMEYENETVFNYIRKLLDSGAYYNGECPDGLFSDRHEDVARKLKDLKDIIVSYYPQRNSDLMNSALFDIIICEKDILAHCGIEDKLFEPAVRELEARGGNEKIKTPASKVKKQPDAIKSLSDREKEIIRLVACGMSNKEIAEALCLSIHTVTTHRRNLSSKLDIHSPSALTLFAIINHLVDLDQIKLPGQTRDS